MAVTPTAPITNASVSGSPGWTPNRMPDITEPRAEAESRPDRQPDAGKQADATEDKGGNMGPLCAKREPDAELARALRHGVAGHAENSDAGQHERERRERAHQAGRESWQRDRPVVARIHRFSEIHRHRRVDRGQC